MSQDMDDAGIEWQIDVWDQISDRYQREIDRRFVPVTEAVIARARLAPGERVLDLGTGTGALALRAAAIAGPDGKIVASDISPEMLRVARRRAAAVGLDGIEFLQGRAEAIPAEDGSFDAVLASLSLMYVIDRAEAAREIARVLRPGGRLVAAVWGAADECDIVLFQETAGGFAPSPPVTGVGPGSLADAAPFVGQLARAGIAARVEKEILEFEFDDFESAWDVLAPVTTAHLAPDVRDAARRAVRERMGIAGDSGRRFRNATQFILGRSRGRA